MTPSVGPWLRKAGWVAIFAVAFAVRAGNLAAAKPYINYVDEGNFLHSVVKLLRTGTWNSDFYLYPQVPMTAVAATVRISDPIHRAFGGPPLRGRLSGDPMVYDVLEPFDVLLVARTLNLVLGLLVVAGIALFARRLAGPVAGFAAASLAAVTPALAIRGSIATVDIYATFFVLLSLYFVHASRGSSRPGRVCFGAGAMAGLAFASKYPAALVILAFAVSTLLEKIPWREKARRAALAAAGLGVGAAVGMPAVLVHPRDVVNAIRAQATIYSQLTSPASLWDQVAVRAEWNLTYEGAELGAIYLLLAVAGVGLGIRDRRLSTTVWGWLAFGGVSILLFSRQAFHPFRNLLPLVPLAALSAAILYARLRERLRRPLLLDLLAIGWAGAAFVAPLAAHGAERARLADSRREAVDWLAAHRVAGDPVLFVRELGFVRAEIERLGPAAREAWWADTPAILEAESPRFLVAGMLERPDGVRIDVPAVARVLERYAVRYRSGRSRRGARTGGGEAIGSSSMSSSGGASRRPLPRLPRPPRVSARRSPPPGRSRPAGRSSSRGAARAGRRTRETRGCTREDPPVSRRASVSSLSIP